MKQVGNTMAAHSHLLIPNAICSSLNLFLALVTVLELLETEGRRGE